MLNIGKTRPKKPSCHDFLPRPEAAGSCLPPCLGTCPVFASINPLWPQTPEEGVSVLMSQGSPSTCIFGFHTVLPPQETHSNDCPLLPWQISLMMVMTASTYTQLHWIEASLWSHCWVFSIIDEHTAAWRSCGHGCSSAGWKRPRIQIKSVCISGSISFSAITPCCTGSNVLR